MNHNLIIPNLNTFKLSSLAFNNIKFSNHVFEKSIDHAQCMMLLAKRYNNGTRKGIRADAFDSIYERGPPNYS